MPCFSMPTSARCRTGFNTTRLRRFTARRCADALTISTIILNFATPAPGPSNLPKMDVLAAQQFEGGRFSATPVNRARWDRGFLSAFEDNRNIDIENCMTFAVAPCQTRPGLKRQNVGRQQTIKQLFDLRRWHSVAHLSDCRSVASRD